MADFFFEITVIICFAAALSIIFRIFKQPEILAYILTGILIGPLGLFKISDQASLSAMSQLGITLLLFMVGLEIKISDLLSLGKSLFFAAAGQIIFSFFFGFLISELFHFNSLETLYVSMALTFSSTIIIVKILSDKRDLHSLYAKISLSILLAQDLLAILALMFLSGLNQQTGGYGSILDFALVGLKAVVLFEAVIYLSSNIFPKIVELIAKSSETLFLVSIAWVFGLAALVSSPFIGFSIEIGGFLAGLSLANSMANYQIIAKAKILRDFFIVIFFVLLGMQMTFANLSQSLVPAIILSIFVLLGKPLIVMVIMGFMGYRKRTSFLTGLSLSQISEFSLILVFLGYKLGHISANIVSVITLVGIITFTVSTYLVSNGNRLYLLLNKKLNFLEIQNVKKDEMVVSDGFEDLKNHVVVIGGDQMGQSIVDALDDLDLDVVVIDFDPEIVKKLEGRKIHRLFGDISDLDIQERAQLDSAKLVISTVPDIEDNLLLLKELRNENRKAKVVVMALDTQDAKQLYKAHADYVILPHLAGGMRIAKELVEEDWSKIERLKKKDLEYLD